MSQQEFETVEMTEEEQPQTVTTDASASPVSQLSKPKSAWASKLQEFVDSEKDILGGVLPSNSFECGWAKIAHIDFERILDVFSDSQQEIVRKRCELLKKLINQYCTTHKAYRAKLCAEHKIDESAFYTTDNEAIVAERKKYHLYEGNEMDELALEAPQDDVLQTYSIFSSIAAAVQLAKLDKQPFVMTLIKDSLHIPVFHPFGNKFEADDIFDSVSIQNGPPSKRRRIEEDSSIEALDDTRPQTARMQGYFIFYAQRRSSHGLNRDGKKFDVIDIIDPSLSIIRKHLNNYLRKWYPTAFDGSENTLFFNVKETRDTVKLNCLDKTFEKNQIIIMANATELQMTLFKGRVVPQIIFYTNCVLERK